MTGANQGKTWGLLLKIRGTIVAGGWIFRGFAFANLSGRYKSTLSV
jgi:hypothetical protein